MDTKVKAKLIARGGENFPQDWDGHDYEAACCEVAQAYLEQEKEIQRLRELKAHTNAYFVAKNHVEGWEDKLQMTHSEKNILAVLESLKGERDG